MRATPAVIIIYAFSLVSITGSDFRFAGKRIFGGETVRAEVPLNAAEKSYTVGVTRDPPSTAVAVIAVPRGFDPRRTWPVLVVFSTTDFKRLNRDDLVDFYRNAALAQNWVIIAGDGHNFESNDSNGWRAAMTLAALDALHNSFPGSRNWPVAVAGFSGGAKRASLLAPLLFLEGCRLCGIYLAGVNEDSLSVSYRKARVGREFLNIPIFISSGTNDNIAPPGRAGSVVASIKSSGFRFVRLETFSGGHGVKNTHTIEALRWFRAQPKEQRPRRS